MSDPSSVDNLSDIFLKIAEAPTEQRSELLDRLCPDESTRQKVCSLLEADEAVDPLLDHALFPKPVELQPGDRVSGYKLVKELALGGMGIVYLAEQLEPIRRQVALKVIKPGVDTREVVARFNAERQTLSLIDHPNIAKAFDAGSTDTGRPFFVMELVNGQLITSYCEQQRLTIEQRLEIFISVCRAIQHAHQKGVIHRDIKPSNVLVAKYDGRPIAKVIDFGVAKAINQTMTTATLATGLGQIVGTFDYMSPEQSHFNQREVDTRSDIYSLGVLLYELLTDTPAFDRERLRSAQFDELLKIIQEEDPPRPSVRLSENKDKEWSDSPTQAAEESSSPVDASVTTMPSVSRLTEVELKKRIRRVRGELDWIVMKSMDKDPDRRYATPEGLASDIERFLVGEVVAASPPSPLYRLRKFARRNKTKLAVVGLAICALFVGLSGAAYHYIQVASAKTSASVAALEFVVEELLGLDDSPTSDGYSPDPNVSFLKLLQNASNNVDERLADWPETKARMKSLLARSFKSLGQYDDAERLYRDYLEFLSSTKGFADSETIRVMEQLVRLHLRNSHLSKAKTLADDALRYSRSYLGDEHELTLQLLNDRAMLFYMQDMGEEAVDAHRFVLEVRRRTLGDWHPETLDTMTNLGIVLDSLGRFGEAQQLFENTVSGSRESLSPNDARLAAALQRLGKFLLADGRRDGSVESFPRAEKLLLESIDIYDRNRGPSHVDTLQSKYLLGQVLVERRSLEEAQNVLEDLVERLQKMREPNDRMTLQATNMLGWVYMSQSRYPEAENILSNTLEQLRRSESKDTLEVQVMGNLAIVRFKMGKLVDAMMLDQQTIELAEELLGDSHPQALAAKTRLGLARLYSGDSTEANRLFEEVYRSNESLGRSSFVLDAIERSSNGQQPAE
ncbi:MAG: tetratricopeptide repeat protein [Planctomycetota bacterium]